MVAHRSERLRASSTRLWWTQLFRQRGTASTANRLEKRLRKTQKRLLLVEAERRHLLLLQKETMEQVQQLEHRKAEMLLPLPSQLSLDSPASPSPKELEPVEMPPLLQQLLSQTRDSTPQD